MAFASCLFLSKSTLETYRKGGMERCSWNYFEISPYFQLFWRSISKACRVHMQLCCSSFMEKYIVFFKSIISLWKCVSCVKNQVTAGLKLCHLIPERIYFVCTSINSFELIDLISSRINLKWTQDTVPEFVRVVMSPVRRRCSALRTWCPHQVSDRLYSQLKGP